MTTKCVLSLLFALFVYGSTVYADAPPAAISMSPDKIPDAYKSAEDNAPGAAKLDLAALRERGKQEGWKFAVGYTSAFAAPLSDLAGTKIPENFLAVAIARNELAAKANGAADESARLAGVKAPQYLGSCSPDSKGFNWRDEGAMQPVENQGKCGSCWAFSAAATYDASYRIRNGIPVGVSEQHILSCAVDNKGNRAGSCQGGWYDPAFQWMIAKGTIGQSALPYSGKDGSCPITAPGPYRAIATGFVTSKSGIPLIREIKQAVCQYGPISVAMEATTAFQAYSGGFFNERSNGGDVNHAVTLVGWNDDAGGPDQGAWLVRNSWSAAWGDKGYAWMEYNTNRIGYAAAWVRPVQENVPVPSGALLSALTQASGALQAASVLIGEVGATTSAGKLEPFTDALKQSRSTVWVQYGKPEQKTLAEQIRDSLTKAGYFAPAIEDVSTKLGRLPSKFQVRYFISATNVVADQVAKIVKESGVSDIDVKLIPGYPNVNSIEIWFPVN